VIARAKKTKNKRVENIDERRERNPRKTSFPSKDSEHQDPDNRSFHSPNLIKKHGIQLCPWNITKLRI
jgi:hypothetical protein